MGLYGLIEWWLGGVASVLFFGCFRIFRLFCIVLYSFILLLFVFGVYLIGRVGLGLFDMGWLGCWGGVWSFLLFGGVCLAFFFHSPPPFPFFVLSFISILQLRRINIK